MTTHFFSLFKFLLKASIGMPVLEVRSTKHRKGYDNRDYYRYLSIHYFVIPKLATPEPLS